MGFFKNDKKNKPPHTWYPEVLHWQEGDTIYCRNISRAFGYKNAKKEDILKYMKPNEVIGKVRFIYKSINNDGSIYLTDPDDHLVQFEFWRFIKVSTNETLKSRLVEQKQQDSEGYMELMKNFQNAYNELEESDNPKRLK